MARKGMRQDARTADTTADIASVQRYHQGNWGSENYAYNGFVERLLFTSDRFVKLDENYHRIDGKPLTECFGLEIETTCDDITNQTVLAEVFSRIIFPNFPKALFKMQNDSSLGGATNAECITQIMTRQAIRNNYPAFKMMYDTYFPSFSICCDDGSCGMHTNISVGAFGKTADKQADNIKKLGYFINHNFALCCSLFRRNARQTHYCQRMSSFADKETARNIDLSDCGCSHGISFNCGHYNVGRIEIRLVGGQKNYASFRNTMETIFHLIDSVKRLSWNDLDDMVKVFSGCNQYVFDRLTLARREGQITDADVNAIQPTVVRDNLL